MPRKLSQVLAQWDQDDFEQLLMWIDGDHKPYHMEQEYFMNRDRTKLAYLRHHEAE